MKAYIPAKKNIYKTNKEDPIFWYYFPLVGYFYRKRLINTLTFLGKDYNRLLDIGYGSGILFPELSSRAKRVFGLEIHGKEKLVGQMLKKEKINNVILRKGSIYKMPFENNYFDCIVSVSTLEHLQDLDKAMLEVKRVLRPNGQVVFSFPVRNIITDCFFKFAGYSPRKVHPSSHLNILNEAKRYFVVDRILKFPNFSNINYSLYCSLRCIKHD